MAMLGEVSEYFDLSSLYFVGSLLDQMRLKGTIKDGKPIGFSHN